jgi:sedoheptulose-bisphosphatase
VYFFFAMVSSPPDHTKINRLLTIRVLQIGETEWTKSGQFTGTTEIELTQAGAEQVSSAATTLVGAGKFLDPYCLAHVFVSPRVRARNTFKLLLDLSLVAKKVTYTEDIMEWDYGDYEGLTDEQTRNLRKERGLDLQRRWNIWSDGCEGGE